MTEPQHESAREKAGGSGGAWMVLAVVFGLSTLLGVFFFWQYSRTMAYVKYTIDEPEGPLPYEVAAYSPEDCVDYSMDWAAECTGVKTLCDMYVDRVITLCLESQDRTAYCDQLGERTETAEFGVDLCRERGVQKNVDKEACGHAYRAIVGYCERYYDMQDGAIIALEEEGS